MTSVNQSWTTVADIAAKVRRRYVDGSLLREYARGTELEPIEISLRGPRPSEVGNDLVTARAWVATLDAGRQSDRRYSLQWQAIGGRSIGRNQLPVRAVVSSYTQAWALLGVTGEVRRLDEAMSAAADHPGARTWIIDNPHRALAVADDMPGLVVAATWLKELGGGRYLREISAPGVDTKFTERHRTVLAGILAVSATPSRFLGELGLRSKPELVRFRPARSLGLAPELTELAVRAEELSAVPLAPSSALVIENEITYLSVPVPNDGVVLWGKGFEVDRVGRLPWLQGVPVTYWGDLDTHGFAILDRLRTWLPQTRSLLMDRQTLLEHRDRWGVEERPTKAALTRLTTDEHTLYGDLVTDAVGERIRLEQERIDWDWAQARLASEV
jgi:hypothetical protein